MYKSEHSGENNSVIEIPLFDDTKEKYGNTYPPLKYSPTLRSRGMGDFYVKLLSIVEKEPEICYSIKGK